ncbi:hypothetical protein ABFX02_05G073600 [Erythranthe guttata]
MNVARRTRNKGGYVSQFRSNLTSTVTFFEGLQLYNAHLECLKRSPFFNLVLPFAKHKVTNASVTGTQNGCVEFFLTYKPSENAFEIGGNKLKLTPTDCQLNGYSFQPKKNQHQQIT